MIRAKILLEPNGDKDRVREMGEIEITNVTTGGGRMSSDYLWRIRCQVARQDPIDACGYLVDSRNGSMVDLLQEVLAEWKSKRPLPIDNHGQQTLPEGISISAAELWQRFDRREKNASGS